MLFGPFSNKTNFLIFYPLQNPYKSSICTAYQIYVLPCVGNKVHHHREIRAWKFCSGEVLRGLEVLKHLESVISIGTELQLS